MPANEGCSGTSGTKTLTLAAAGGFANNDLILIHQTRGTGAGTWQLNKIVSGATTTTLTLKYDLTNTYTDSGASQAQCIELNQYKDLTTGAITAPAWNGSKGGIIAFFDKGDCVIGGTITATGKGYLAGLAGGSGNNQGGIVCNGGGGEGAVKNQARSDPAYNAAIGNAGRGGEFSGTTVANGRSGGGGGGANGANGTAGTAYAGTGGTNGGYGGTADGNVSLTDMVMGGGGGGGGGTFGGGGSAGGAGGGIVIIISNTITITGAIVTGGNNGAAEGGNWEASGGGGAGGSVLFKAITATLGTTKTTAPAGTYGADSAGGNHGGAGSVGRIHLDYSKSYTGTTSPTIDVTLDTTIKAGGPNFFAFFQFL